VELSFAVLEHRPSTGDADCGLGLDSQKVHAEYTIKKNIQIMLNRYPACGKLPHPKATFRSCRSHWRLSRTG